MRQPFLLQPTPDAATLLAGLVQSPAARLHIWLEAWQRLVTPLDDPGIKDVALGEADTTDRLQTVWRVVAEPATASDSNRSCCNDMRLARRPVPPGLMTVGVQDASGQETACRRRMPVIAGSKISCTGSKSTAAAISPRRLSNGRATMARS